ncbi:hypothetical protein GCM10010289_00980 [Streptomyces violascens]|nr:hypothetical protein GCM10010289_00980 [Streptomyces violascens]
MASGQTEATDPTHLAAELGPVPKLLSAQAAWLRFESKKAMNARGMSSPDRTEAVLVVLCEPEPSPQAAQPRPPQLDQDFSARHRAVLVVFNLIFVTVRNRSATDRTHSTPLEIT